MKTRIPKIAAIGLAGVLMNAMAEPEVSFSGYVDVDHATAFEKDFETPTHKTGLEVDLTTAIKFTDAVSAVIYTTMNDGVVPALGAGNWWPSVNFDGVTLTWQKTDNLALMSGDLIYGVGYFGYYAYKRSAAVVGEHAVRGLGFSFNGLTVSSGLTGDPDSTGARSAWATFAKYDLSLGEGLSLTPALKYTAGIAGATPIVGGLYFSGEFGAAALNASVGFNYYNDDFDPGFIVVVEPSFSSGMFSVAGTFLYNEKGDTQAFNIPATTLAPSGKPGSVPFDDMLVYVEPGVSFSDAFAFGLPLEYHDSDMDVEENEEFWVVPTFYVYPAENTEVWLWGGAFVPLGDEDPYYGAGIETIFTF